MWSWDGLSDTGKDKECVLPRGFRRNSRANLVCPGVDIKGTRGATDGSDGSFHLDRESDGSDGESDGPSIYTGVDIQGTGNRTVPSIWM